MKRTATFPFPNVVVAVLLGAVALAPVLLAGATDPPAKATEEEWRDALATCRKVAFDAGELAPQRVAAIAAYARLLVARGQADKALAECKQCVVDTNVPLVAEAALRTACQLTRQSGGTLAAEVALLESWKDAIPAGPTRPAFEAARQEVARVRVFLTDLQGRRMVPEPARVALPGWAVSPPAGAGPAVLNLQSQAPALPAWAAPADGNGPAALKSVTVPVLAPPGWCATLQFPPLPPK